MLTFLLTLFIYIALVHITVIILLAYLFFLLHTLVTSDYVLWLLDCLIVYIDLVCFCEVYSFWRVHTRHCRYFTGLCLARSERLTVSQTCKMIMEVSCNFVFTWRKGQKCLIINMSWLRYCITVIFMLQVISLILLTEYLWHFKSCRMCA